MNRFLLIFLLLAITSPAFSQKHYFIYLQSESEQPFFVKLNDKIHSSSAGGYLVLSRLRDSSYAITIGFPQNKFPEQKFVVDIKDKDRGVLLKNFGEKGWGLFDLQTLTMQMALPVSNGKAIKTVPRDDISPFTEILAKAANDPSLKERPVVAKAEDKAVAVQNAVLKEEVKPVATSSPDNKAQEILRGNKDSIAGSNSKTIVKSDVPPPTRKEQQLVIEIVEPSIGKSGSVVKAEEKSNSERSTEYKRSVVMKRSESSTSEGFGLTYIDEYADGKKDTIRIIIPNQRLNSAETKEQVRDNKKFLDISSGDSVRLPVSETTTSASPLTFTNMNCKALASDDDLSKLQKKMIGKKEEEDMIDEAKKMFKGKCFTAEQVKRLSALFSTDVNRYKFFDAAYAFVSDTENFASLSAELKDEYYIKRFKAMLR